MNTLLENGVIEEIICGSNFAYVLSDSSYFLPIEYKVLHSQSGDCFVQCVRVLYNGKIQLYYLADSYKPLSAMLFGMNPDAFVKIAVNLLSSIIEVKSNGFLSCCNIEASLDKVYVEPSTRKVRLVYLPLSEHLYRDYEEFERELRTSLIRMINGVPALFTDRTMSLAVDLANGMLPLEDVLARLKENSRIASDTTVIRRKRLRLVEVNGSEKMMFKINTDAYVLGKHPAEADGVISNNKAVSRRHCIIEKTENGYTVTDLGSLNGTYLNQEKLSTNRPYPLKHGDELCLADSRFQVEFQ